MRKASRVVTLCVYLSTYVYRAYLCEKHRARRGPNQSRYLNEGDARIYVRACATHRALARGGNSGTAIRIPYRKQACAQCGHWDARGKSLRIFLSLVTI